VHAGKEDVERFLSTIKSQEAATAPAGAEGEWLRPVAAARADQRAPRPPLRRAVPGPLSLRAGAASPNDEAAPFKAKHKSRAASLSVDNLRDVFFPSSSPPPAPPALSRRPAISQPLDFAHVIHADKEDADAFLAALQVGGSSTVPDGDVPGQCRTAPGGSGRA
jgi:hypothetical protein